ncbi:MAG: SDR family oxidoreductase [Bacteroidetes bacterium]|nr:SDR family oxidoreductase [Bacteroidota bacterium]
MDVKGMVVFITGASSGIGQACARKFAKGGAQLLLIARRIERLKKLSNELETVYGCKVYVQQVDVRDSIGIAQFFAQLPEEWKAIDILINNAGLSRGLDKIYEGQLSDWEEMIDTNVKGLLCISRLVIPGMVQRRKGTIINIGSIAGHEVYPRGNVYCATKHAVNAITKGMRLDLVDTPIRVCTVDPGLVETEFSYVRFHGDVHRAKKVYENIVPLTADDVADVVYFVATRPPHVQIAEVIVFPTCQASSWLVHRDLPKGTE